VRRVSAGMTVRRVVPATAALAAVLVTFLLLYPVSTAAGAGPSAAVLGAVIALGLARRPAPREHLHIAVEALALPLVGLTAAGVGLLFMHLPLVAAALFTVALAGSMWLRGLPGDARVVGRAIALPFIAMLVVPSPVTAGSPLTGIGLALAAGLVALAVTWCVQRLLPGRSDSTDAPVTSGATAAPRAATGTPHHVRAAVQLGAALTLAFTFGFTLFPAHWPWIVLTAFIVTASTRGREDALYKGLLRLSGAIAGTALALVLVLLPPMPGPAYATLIFVVLYAGLLLRESNYAYWAAATTAIFALLHNVQPGEPPAFWVRVLCIAIGACCGIASSFLVLPLRTRDVARKRLADALAWFDRFADAPDAARAALARGARELSALYPALALWQLVPGADGNDDAAAWARASASILERASRPHSTPSQDALVAARLTRKAIRDRDGIAPALARLEQALREMRNEKVTPPP